MKKNAKMALALLIITVLTVVIAYATLPYLNSIFGALILFVIFRSLYHFLVRRARLRKQFAAVLVIIVSIFVVLIPLFFLLNVIISEIQQLLLDQASIIASIESGGQLFNSSSLKAEYSCRYIPDQNRRKSNGTCLTGC